MCGLENGYRIYNTDPLKENANEVGGGISHVEMLYRCNYVGLVSGGKSPKYPKNKGMRTSRNGENLISSSWRDHFTSYSSSISRTTAIVWDDYQKKVAISLEFNTDVLSIKLRRDRYVNNLIWHLYTLKLLFCMVVVVVVVGVVSNVQHCRCIREANKGVHVLANTTAPARVRNIRESSWLVLLVFAQHQLEFGLPEPQGGQRDPNRFGQHGSLARRDNRARGGDQLHAAQQRRLQASHGLSQGRWVDGIAPSPPSLKLHTSFALFCGD